MLRSLCQPSKAPLARIRPPLSPFLRLGTIGHTSFFSSSDDVPKAPIKSNRRPRAANPVFYRGPFLDADSSREVPFHPLARKPPRARASNPEFFKEGFVASSNTGESGQRLKSNWSASRPFRRKVGSNQDAVKPVYRIRPRPESEADRAPTGREINGYGYQPPQPEFGTGADQMDIEVNNTPPPEWETVADYLEYCGGLAYAIPKTTWVRIDNIMPISSLEYMLKGIDEALNAEEARGIINLDQKWAGEEKIECLPPMAVVENNPKWVRNARLILSPFSRPKGWFLQFDNRSIVNALLSRATDYPVRCAYRDVNVSACKLAPPSEIDGTEETAPLNEDPNSLLDPKISDHTLRVENCPLYATKMSLINFFSRYDLMDDVNCVQKWDASTTDGRRSRPTYLVHFADVSFARAALRETQSTYLPFVRNDGGYEDRDGPLLLAQYPKQIW